MYPNHAIHRRFELYFAALLAAYFISLNWDRATMHFAQDEMMNIAAYFTPGPWRVLVSHITIWLNVQRPLGGAFYLPLYYLFGLNPAPYQIVFTLIVAANGYWLYQLARVLGCGRLAAGLATIAGIYHPGLTNLHYNTDMIFDVLCFFFFYAALVYYVRIRRQGRAPRWRQGAVLLALYLAALDAKEMAVTLPLIVAAYEWFYHGWSGLRDSWRVTLPAIVMNLAYAAGKTLGPDPLAKAGGYDMVFSRARFLRFQRASVGEIIGWHNDWSVTPVIAIWSLVTLLAWRGRHPALRVCWYIMAITPLPIAFLTGRGQGCLYIPMAGWVIFAAIVLLYGLRTASELVLRYLHHDGVVAVLAAVAVVLWCVQVREWKRSYINSAAASQGVHTREMIRQFQELHPSVRPGGRIVFLHNPFEGWDMVFIGELVLRDRKLDIRLQDHNALPESELHTADAVFDYRDGKLLQVR
jgi:hypothetical protein